MNLVFLDRMDAGRELSDKLKKYKDDGVIVLAIPRGGLEIAYDTIKRFNFSWDLIIPKKIGAPHNNEIAIGVVSMDGSYITDDYYVKALNISEEYIKDEAARQAAEIKRRMREYRRSDTFPDVDGKTVIIMDDGIATGFTVLAAVKAIKNHGAEKIVLAVPVGPRETIEEFENIVDEVICLHVPDEFYAVGLYYRDFMQLDDEDVLRIIDELEVKK